MRQNIPNRDRGAAGGRLDAPRTSPHGMPLEGHCGPGHRGQVAPAHYEVELPDPHTRYDITGRRRGVVGTASLTDLRIFAASVCAPLLLVAAAVFAVLAARRGFGSSNHEVFMWLALACLVLSVGAAVDVAQEVWRHRRKPRRTE